MGEGKHGFVYEEKEVKSTVRSHGAFFMSIFSKLQVCRKFGVSLLQVLTIFVTQRK